VSLFLADTIVLPGQGSAEGLAKLIVADIMRFMPLDELKKRFAGAAFDGQYILEGIQANLLALLGGTREWRTVQWDPAHQVELALHDVRLDKTGTMQLNDVDWYGPLAETVAVLLNQFQYGKGYEEAREIATEMLIAFRDPQKLCDTRFAQSEVKCYDNFLADFPVFAEFYKTASTIPAGATKGKGKALRTERNADERAKLELYNLLRDQLNVGRILVLRDLLTHVRAFSLFAQA